jgi:hypothetical protein
MGIIRKHDIGGKEDIAAQNYVLKEALGVNSRPVPDAIPNFQYCVGANAAIVAELVVLADHRPVPAMKAGSDRRARVNNSIGSNDRAGSNHGS